MAEPDWSGQWRLVLSVTRFDEISPLWQNWNNFGIVLRAYLVFGNVLSLLWQNLFAVGRRFIAVNGQILVTLLVFRIRKELVKCPNYQHRNMTVLFAATLWANWHIGTIIVLAKPILVLPVVNVIKKLLSPLLRTINYLVGRLSYKAFSLSFEMAIWLIKPFSSM